MTNFEKIKNMSIDKMAGKLDDVFTYELCPIEVFCRENTKIITCKSVWEKLA
mgnify:FL=1